MSKLKSVFPQASLLQLYYVLVHPLLLCGLIIGRSTHISYFSKLKILQNKAIKNVSHAHHRDTAKPIYATLKILQLEDRYKFQTEKFVYNWKRKTILRPLMITSLQLTKYRLEVPDNAIIKICYSLYSLVSIKQTLKEFQVSGR